VSAARGPDARIGAGKDRHHRRADSRGKVADTGVVADIDPGSGEPAAELIQIVEPHGVVEQLVRSGRPLDCHWEPGGKGSKIFERPILFGTAGEGMNHGEIARDRGRHRDSWDALCGRRKRGKEGEGQMTDGVAKFGVLGPVPGVNRIEALEREDLCAGRHANQVEACIGDGASAIGKTDERKHSAWRPYFGVLRAGGFQLGQREDAIADGAGTNEQTAVHYFRP